MGLNIKSEEVHRMVAELAHLKGQNLTQAVAEAVRSALAEEKRRRGREGLAKDLLAIGRRCAPHIDPALTSLNFSDALFDETGMP